LVSTVFLLVLIEVQFSIKRNGNGIYSCVVKVTDFELLSFEYFYVKMIFSCGNKEDIQPAYMAHKGSIGQLWSKHGPCSSSYLTFLSDKLPGIFFLMSTHTTYVKKNQNFFLSIIITIILTAVCVLSYNM
jgi:hypothetical protein